jgi:hypothetical protein
MQATSEIAAFERGVYPVLRLALPEKTARAILNFRPDPRLRTRIGKLAAKSTEGRLTKSERAEYAGYVRANKFVAILRRQARHLAAAAA